MSAIDMRGEASSGSFKFETIGDTVRGVVTYLGSWEERENRFTGQLETILKIGITPDGGEQVAIWPRRGSAMMRAIADAVVSSGATSLEEGGTLAVKFSETKDTGKGQPAKLFVAKYEPPKASGVKSSDLF